MEKGGAQFNLAYGENSVEHSNVDGRMLTSAATAGVIPHELADLPTFLAMNVKINQRALQSGPKKT